jgi:putative transcriptional regulator
MRRLTFGMILFAAAACAAGVAHAQAENDRVFLLVAQPGMLDPVFEKTVVLAIRADDGGPIGVILNRPSTASLRSLLPDRADATDRNDPVFLGGPIAPDALLFAFRAGSMPSRGLAVADDIYISGSGEVLTEILHHPENAMQQRFFTGFSGWAVGQLEQEIERGGWFVLRFDARAMFDMNPLTLYDELLQRVTAPGIETAREIHLAHARPR